MTIYFSHFLGDSFVFSSVVFGVVSWIIAMVGIGLSPHSANLRFTCWGLMFEMILILVIVWLYLKKYIEFYRFTLVVLLSAAFVYTTNATNNLIYTGFLGHMCCAAGCILISALNVLWMIYFGGHPQSPTKQFLDSFAGRLSAFT